MKKILLVLPLLLLSLGSGCASLKGADRAVASPERREHRYTRSELETFAKEDLISIVLRLQGDDDHGPGRDNCQSFSAESPDKEPLLFGRVNNSYDAQHGTLLWPNGKVFRLRNGYDAQNGTLFYPNGQKLRLRNGYDAQNGTLYYPNGKVLRLMNNYDAFSGSWYRADGSLWYIRNSYDSRNGTRVGLPVEQFSDGELEGTVSLLGGGEGELRLQMRGPGWTIRIEGDQKNLTVTECLGRR